MRTINLVGAQLRRRPLDLQELGLIVQHRSRRLLSLLATLTAVHLTAAECSSQAPSTIEIGDRIRLAMVAEPAVTGTLVELDSTQLILDVAPAGRGAYELASIQKLERSTGYYRDGNIWPAVGIGAAAGAVAGLGIAGLSGVMKEGHETSYNTAIAIAVGAGLGAVAGAIIGSGPRKERWEPVPLGGLRVGFQPPRHGTWGLAVSISL